MVSALCCWREGPTHWCRFARVCVVAKAQRCIRWIQDKVITVASMQQVTPFWEGYNIFADFLRKWHHLLHICYSDHTVLQSPGASLGLKGSVERSSLPWAIFLIFTRNRPWKSEDHLCTLFFIEMSKESFEKSERTPPVSWRPWALAYSRDRPYNFSCLSAVSKNRRFRSFFLGFGVSFGEEKPFVTSNVSF